MSSSSGAGGKPAYDYLIKLLLIGDSGTPPPTPRLAIPRRGLEWLFYGHSAHCHAAPELLGAIRFSGTEI